MPETVEHQFLKNSFNQILRSFSTLRLYGFTETERRKFDLSCLLERDWSRPVVGQVAWHHATGIEKDVRTLLTDTDSEIKVYVAQDSVRYRATLEDVVGDFRRSGRFPELFRLKTFWIPSDFDADRESHRCAVSILLQERLVEDLLFNVVFGNITAYDVRMVMSITGVPALAIAILHHVATQGFLNERTLARDLHVNKGPVREKLILLRALGFMTGADRDAYYVPTTKGKVLLELLRRVYEELAMRDFTAELAYVLERLGCRPMPLEELTRDEDVPATTFDWLVRNVRYAVSEWGVDWTALSYNHALRSRIPMQS